MRPKIGGQSIITRKDRLFTRRKIDSQSIGIARGMCRVITIVINSENAARVGRRRKRQTAKTAIRKAEDRHRLRKDPNLGPPIAAPGIILPKGLI